MKKNQSTFLSLFFITWLFPTYAMDTHSPIIPQDLIISDSDLLSLKKKVIRISPQEVRVEEEYFNGTDKDILSNVTFLIPPYRCDDNPPLRKNIQTYADAAPFFDWAKFKDLKISVNDTPVPIARDIHSPSGPFVNDTAEQLKKHGINDIDCPDLSKVDKRTLQTLEERGEVWQMRHTFGADIPSVRWTIQTIHRSRISFPANKNTKIAYAYGPRLGIITTSGNFHSDRPWLFKDEQMLWADKNSLEASIKYGGIRLGRTEGSGQKKAAEQVEVIIEGTPLVWAYFDGNLYTGIGKIHIKQTDHLIKEDLTFAFATPNKDIPFEFYKIEPVKGSAEVLLSPQGKVIATVPDKTNVQIMDYVSGWFRIKYQGKIGFIQDKKIDINSRIIKPKYYFSRNSLPNCTPETQPTIKLLSPKGGEVLQVGQKVKVNWQSCNVTPPVNIGLMERSPDGGSAGSYPGDAIEDDGEHEFILEDPTSLAPGLGHYFHFSIHGSHDPYNRGEYSSVEDNGGKVIIKQKKGKTAVKKAIQDDQPVEVMDLATPLE